MFCGSSGSGGSGGLRGSGGRRGSGGICGGGGICGSGGSGGSGGIHGRRQKRHNITRPLSFRNNGKRTELTDSSFRNGILL